MRILLKYFFWLLSFVSLVLYYLLGTTLGHLNIGYLLENYLNKKSNNKLEVQRLDIEMYPYIEASLKINDHATLILKGEFNLNNSDMTYDLEGETFQWGRSIIPYPVDLRGTLKGDISYLKVEGAGSLFDGKTTYSFIRTPKRLENLKIDLNEVNATQLLTFLRYKTLLEGYMDIEMEFDYYTPYQKQGSSIVSMKKALIPEVSSEIPFSLDAKIIFDHLVHDFNADLYSDVGKLRIANGHYNRSAALLTADYGLQIKELAYFEEFLKHKFIGVFNTAGSLKYEQDELVVNGDTTHLEGLVEYQYKKNQIEFNFQSVSLEKILQQLAFPALLSSRVYGTASYDLKNEIVLVNTELKKTRFRRTKMADMLYQYTGVDILKDEYNDSVFSAAYEDPVLTSYLRINNGRNHLYLNDTRMNAKTNGISSDFEVKLDGEEFFGEIYGTLENPQVNLDMSKLFKYQLNKKIENFFGQGKPLNRENTKEKLGELQNDLNIDNIKQKTRNYLDGFFD